jgi:hypothetical protein
MPVDDNADIITDSDDLGNENEVTPEEVVPGDEKEDSLEAIADRLAAQRAERDDSDDFNKEISDLDTPIDQDDDEESEKLVTLVIDGKTVEVSQAELESNYQFDSSARKRMTEASELRKQMEKGLADVEEMKTKFVTPTTPAADPEPEQVEDFDLQDFTVKMREGSDEDALEAVKAFSKMFKSTPAAATPDVASIVDARLAEISQKAEDDAAALEAEAFTQAEQGFNNDFKADISGSDDFFELAAMEDRKLVNDPEWQDKPVKERLTEAGNRARTWVGKRDSGDKLRIRDKQKERHIPRKAATKRSDIGVDIPAPTASSIIAEMRAERGLD